MHFIKAAKMVTDGLATTERYEEFLVALEALATDVPGCFGVYRRKLFLDVLLSVGVLMPKVITRFPVAPNAGTQLSLAKIYGVRAKVHHNEAKWSSLLNHFWHQFIAKSGAYTSRDSKGTLSMMLCGWRRSQATVKFAGGSTNALARAIADEEREYTAFRERIEDDSDTDSILGSF